MRPIPDRLQKPPKKKKIPAASKGTSLEFEHAWAVDKLNPSVDDCPKGLLYIP